MARFHIPRPSEYFSILNAAYLEFRLNDPLRMAAATAFFTTFALPAILLILIQLFGFFSDPQAVSHDIFKHLDNTIDKNAVLQIRQIIRNVHYRSLTWYAKTGVFIFLLFVATTLFKVIKDSVNQLWKIQLKEKPGIMLILGYRAKAVAVIVMAGLLFFVVLFGETTGSLLKKYTLADYPSASTLINAFIDQFSSLLAVITCFTVIFRFLSDGRPSVRISIAGGVFTGVMFSAGRLILQLLLSYSKIQTIYGASTAFVLLLLFVFYSSFIFYYGACFTKVLGDWCRQPIQPTPHAVKYIITRKTWEDGVAP